IQPMPLSNSYVVTIAYEYCRTPDVDVEEPKLRRRHPDAPIPHTYEGDRPCTFRPRIDWRSDKSLALVVPWVSLWLFSYEVWLATGDWLFGGVAHSNTKPETNKIERTL